MVSLQPDIFKVVLYSLSVLVINVCLQLFHHMKSEILQNKSSTQKYSVLFCAQCINAYNMWDYCHMVLIVQGDSNKIKLTMMISQKYMVEQI